MTIENSKKYPEVLKNLVQKLKCYCFLIKYCFIRQIKLWASIQKIVLKWPSVAFQSVYMTYLSVCMKAKISAFTFKILYCAL